MLFSQLSLNVLLGLGCQTATASPVVCRTDPPPELPAVAQFSLPLPKGDGAADERAAAIEATRAGFLYGPAVAGGPAFPSGPLGNATVMADLASLQSELVPEQNLTAQDAALASEAYQAGAAGQLRTMDEYAMLYNGLWKGSIPEGPAPGILTNYTQDLLFSMQRLSSSPYAVRRLIPSANDHLAFAVDDATATAIAGATLDELFEAGRLFYVDHSAQATLNRTAAHAAACDAYFFIDDKSGDFLPLAIRTGVGANLIYTRQDEPEDWLLAKLMFNGNDLFFSQFQHLASTHEVVHIAWMAAIRTLSTAHPVYGVLNRLMYQVFAVQPIARDILFAPGKAIDAVFGFTGAAAQQFADELYHTRGWGRFRANYFHAELRDRGLLNATVGPELARFPFLEDASVIYDATRTFMTAFVDSYYTADAEVLADIELQAWAAEANGDAMVYDFDESIDTKECLVGILTHMAHLVSTAHHAVNTNALSTASMTLPFHPAALYQPLPTTKGNTSAVSYLPNFDKAVRQLTVTGIFARPLLVDTNRTLSHMFDTPELLARCNDATRAAAATFFTVMKAFSDVVAARAFDTLGLSQGMPFIWRALDPDVAPFSVSI